MSSVKFCVYLASFMGGAWVSCSIDRFVKAAWDGRPRREETAAELVLAGTLLLVLGSLSALYSLRLMDRMLSVRPVRVPPGEDDVIAGRDAQGIHRVFMAVRCRGCGNHVYVSEGPEFIPSFCAYCGSGFEGPAMGMGEKT